MIIEHTHYAIVRDGYGRPRRFVCLLCPLKVGLTKTGHVSARSRERFWIRVAEPGALGQIERHVRREHAEVV